MKILFQNEHFVAVDKPSGLLTTPARFGEKDPRPVLGLELQTKLEKQIFPVHRLDFEVSGLVLFALSASAHSEANRLFETKKVQKIYQALSENQNSNPSLEKLENQDFEWKARILRGKKRAFESPHGKPSLTRARLLGREGEFLKWELRPVTGRPHQLRFDLSRHGFPIVGDVLYGAQSQKETQKIELRSISLEFLDSDFCKRWSLPPILQTEPLFHR
ncbi:MAG: RluA family pseudouridine synthase [Pseudobdellovibrionaceae bacterium]